MDYVCIVCPVSCRVTLTDTNGVLTISGNSCPRGKQHAINEYTCPKRILTTTVPIVHGILNRLPVISSDALPKELLRDCLDVIYKVKATAPILEGEILIKNICGTGVDILSARAMKSKEGD